jgi:hypothetical protein
MQERRKQARKYLMVYSRVFHRENGRILGYLADLSPTGAMIISDDAMPANATLPLSFDLPDPASFPISRLNLEARVAWCNPDIDPSFYNLGLEFSPLGDGEQAIVQGLIDAYEFRRSARHNQPTTNPFGE